MKLSKLFGKCARIACAFLSIVVPATGHAQADFDEIFIFGDSISDAGNVYALTGETSKAPYSPVPAWPYAIGGHHFSNGKTWAERLAQNLNDNSGGKASLKNPGKNGNYAFGGARARSGSGNPSPDSATQIWMYLGDRGGASSDALYVLQFGGNDIRDAIIAFVTGSEDPFAILNNAAQSVAAAVQGLHAAGARNFLVANSPNLAHAPAVIMSGASGLAGLFTAYFNGVLVGQLQLVEIGTDDINIIRLDMAGFTDAVVANPADFGLTDAVVPCLIFLTESDAKCNNPEERLFWDGLHPTAAAHDALGDFATTVVHGG